MYNNKSKKNSFRIATVFVWCICVASFVYGQDNVSLHIGDPAPVIRYSKWIKGAPVTSYDKDRLYVLEFWATWCGPCKAAIPHLSELAVKYKDKATFIGVNIWEKTGNKSYETSLPAVASFVKGMGNKMSYNVAADNNEQYMGNKWMIAAGLNGIPATFLLKEGKIIWIGHPMKLDSIMQTVIAGNYDVAAFKKSFEAQSSASVAASSKFNKLYKPIKDAIDAKKYDTAFNLIDKAILQEPNFASSFNALKFNALLNGVSEKSATDFARGWLKEDSNAGSFVASTIVGKDSLSKSSYEFAAECLIGMLADTNMIVPVINHYLAVCYFKADNIAGAVAAEEKAVKGVKIALNEGKWTGTITENTVSEYEKSLAKYKKQ